MSRSSAIVAQRRRRRSREREARRHAAADRDHALAVEPVDARGRARRDDATRRSRARPGRPVAPRDPEHVEDVGAVAVLLREAEAHVVVLAARAGRGSARPPPRRRRGSAAPSRCRSRGARGRPRARGRSSTRSSGLSSRSVVSSPRKPPGRRAPACGASRRSAEVLEDRALDHEVDVPRAAADVERRVVADLAAQRRELLQPPVDLRHHVGLRVVALRTRRAGVPWSVASTSRVIESVRSSCGAMRT